MRINKFLAECGAESRRGSDELIKAGKVKVNGKNAQCGMEITDNDIVEVSGKVLSLPLKYTYIMLNKPKGYVTTTSDDKDRKTVMDLVKFDKVRLFPVGRLDYDTEGLLILTNDGDLSYRLTHPNNEVGKTYILKIEGVIPPEKLNELKRGVEIDGGKTKKSYVKVMNKVQNETRLEITIFEGKNRQIRKMIESVGFEVKFLKRVSVGELRLGGLNRGEYRHLNKAEVKYLKSL